MRSTHVPSFINRDYRHTTVMTVFALPWMDPSVEKKIMMSLAWHRIKNDDFEADYMFFIPYDHQPQR